MKRLLATVAAIFATSCIVSSSTNHCTNGILDGNESDVDCGGSCAPCSPGRRCVVANDCTSAACFNGICQTGGGGSCSNGVRDGSETDVDCGGGTCPACAPGRRCVVANDCTSFVCNGGLCAAPSCNDGVQNGDETGIDCGGSCPLGCHALGANEPMPNPVGLTIYRILPGASSTLMPGTTAGYAITANVGGSYRLAWTGDGGASGTYKEFWGTVWTPGHFSNVVPGCNASACGPLDPNDYISQITNVPGGQAINWDTFAFNMIDGFDFVVDAEPVIFDFFIDGKRYPNLVYFPATDKGGAISPVGTFPFGLVSN